MVGANCPGGKVPHLLGGAPAVGWKNINFKKHFTQERNMNTNSFELNSARRAVSAHLASAGQDGVGEWRWPRR